jgi:hypothetical protein
MNHIALPTIRAMLVTVNATDKKVFLPESVHLNRFSFRTVLKYWTQGTKSKAYHAQVNKNIIDPLFLIAFHEKGSLSK